MLQDIDVPEWQKNQMITSIRAALFARAVGKPLGFSSRSDTGSP
jgi:hypothetical protein